MDKAQLTELQGKPVGKIAEQLPQLDRDSLVELQALETQAKAPRTTLIAAIDEALKALDDAEPNNDDKDPSAVGDGAGKPAAKAAGKLEPSHWQHPDYAGPITGDQAAWRLQHIKPVKAVRTK